MAFKTTEPYTSSGINSNSNIEPPKANPSNPDLTEYKKYIEGRIGELYQQMQNINNSESQAFRAKTEEEKRKYLEDVAKKDAEKLAMNIVSGDEELRKNYLSAFTNKLSGDNERAKKLMEDLIIVGNNLKQGSINQKSKKPLKVVSASDDKTISKSKPNFFSKLLKTEKVVKPSIPPEAQLNDIQKGLALTNLEKYSENYTQAKKDLIRLSIGLVLFTAYLILIIASGADVSRSVVEALLILFGGLFEGFLFVAFIENICAMIDSKGEKDFYKRVLKEFSLSDREKTEGGLGK